MILMMMIYVILKYLKVAPLSLEMKGRKARYFQGSLSQPSLLFRNNFFLFYNYALNTMVMKIVKIIVKSVEMIANLVDGKFTPAQPLHLPSSVEILKKGKTLKTLKILKYQLQKIETQGSVVCDVGLFLKTSHLN